MMQLRVLLLLPGWDASLSQGHPQQYVASTHFIHLGKERQCEVSCLRKQHDGRYWAWDHQYHHHAPTSSKHGINVHDKEEMIWL